MCIFHIKRRGRRITNESVSWQDINIKLVHAAMEIRVIESKVATPLVLCTLPNDDTSHIYFQGLSITLDVILIRHPIKPWTIHSKTRYNL